MHRSKTFIPAAIVSWTQDELRTLRTMARSGASIDVISRVLNRTPSAVRNKAGLQGISFAASRPVAPDFVKEEIADPSTTADSCR